MDRLHPITKNPSPPEWLLIPSGTLRDSLRGDEGAIGRHRNEMEVVHVEGQPRSRRELLECHSTCELVKNLHFVPVSDTKDTYPHWISQISSKKVPDAQTAPGFFVEAFLKPQFAGFWERFRPFETGVQSSKPSVFSDNICNLIGGSKL